MANLRVADALRNAQLQLIADAINAGSGPGTIKIYSGSQPADADDAVGGGNTLLATLTFADPPEADITNGVLTFDSIVRDEDADATDTATWARIEDSDGNNVFDCDVGTSGATINLNTTSIVIGGPVEITTFTLTAPAG